MMQSQAQCGTIPGWVGGKNKADCRAHVTTGSLLEPKGHIDTARRIRKSAGIEYHIRVRTNLQSAGFPCVWRVCCEVHDNRGDNKIERFNNLPIYRSERFENPSTTQILGGWLCKLIETSRKWEFPRDRTHKPVLGLCDVEELVASALLRNNVQTPSLPNVWVGHVEGKVVAKASKA